MNKEKFLALGLASSLGLASLNPEALAKPIKPTETSKTTSSEVEGPSTPQDLIRQQLDGNTLFDSFSEAQKEEIIKGVLAVNGGLTNLYQQNFENKYGDEFQITCSNDFPIELGETKCQIQKVETKKAKKTRKAKRKSSKAKRITQERTQKAERKDIPEETSIVIVIDNRPVYNKYIQMTETETESKWEKYLPYAIGAVLVIGGVVGGYYLAQDNERIIIDRTVEIELEK